MDGNAMRDMEENSALLNQVSAFPSNRRSVRRKIRKEQTAEMPWAIKGRVSGTGNTEMQGGHHA